MTDVDSPEAPVVQTAPAINEIVERYIALRDRKAELKKAYEAKVETIEAALTRCENYLLKTLQEQGAESIRTPAGTAYISTKTSASVADKEGFMKFIRDNGEWSMLDVRANKTTVDEYRKEHGELPPGVNWSELRTVNVRR